MLQSCTRQATYGCGDSPGKFSSVQFSPLTLCRRGGHEERFSRDPLPVFSAGGPCEQFWHGQGGPLFDAIHPAFPLPTTVSPTLQGVLKDGFGEAVVACDLPEPCKFPSRESLQASVEIPNLVLSATGDHEFQRWATSTPIFAAKG